MQGMKGTLLVLTNFSPSLSEGDSPFLYFDGDGCSLASTTSTLPQKLSSKKVVVSQNSCPFAGPMSMALCFFMESCPIFQNIF